MEARVKEILSWYDSENPGTRTNLARIMNHGRLAGTGRFVILPVDQGFEHGPARSFAVNPGGYDPTYHFRLAIEAGCNAYAAPLGFLEAGAAEFAGDIPLILKMNNHDVLNDEKDPLSAVTASGEGRGAARLRGRGLHDLSRLGQRAGHVPAVPRDDRRVQVVRPGRGGVVLPARLVDQQAGRDGPRRGRLRGADRRPARRAHHQGQAARPTTSSRPRPRRPTRRPRYPVRPSPIGCATWCSRPSPAGASSSSPAGPPTRTTKRSSTSTGPSGTGAGSARSSGGTRSSGPSRAPSSSSPR